MQSSKVKSPSSPLVDTSAHSETSTTFSSSAAAAGCPIPGEQLHNSPKLEGKNKVDVLVIGAGPVGLWTAINLKLRAPHTIIVIYEKYAVYQRKHVVMLDHSSLAGRFKECVELDALCKSLPVKIRCSVLEAQLTSFATRLGIPIVLRNVTDVAAVVAELQPSVLIGADGSHSGVRKYMEKQSQVAPSSHLVSQYLSEKSNATTAMPVDAEPLPVSCGLKEALPSVPGLGRMPDGQEVLDRVLALKYEVQGKAVVLTKNEQYALAKALPGAFSFFEQIGTPTTTVDEGKAKELTVCPPTGTEVTPVTLMIGGLSAEQFATLSGATFRKPYTLAPETFDQMDIQLQQSVVGYLKAKECMKNENRVLGSETIAPVSLSIYAAERFATSPQGGSLSDQRGVSTYLVGDAAFGVPYFRALNNGLICGSQLAQLLADEIQSAECGSTATAGSPVNAARAYTEFMQTYTSSEFARARKTSASYVFSRGFTAMTKHIPRGVQAVKIDDATLQQMQLAMAANPEKRVSKM